MSVETITLGCRLNFAESETLKRQTPSNRDLIIVNSCAVTNESVRQTRQAIRRAKRNKPNTTLIVTGCAVQLQPESFAGMPEVDEIRINSFDAAARASSGLMHRVKSFVAVQTGCDHRCTFCSIWQARGRSRSVPFEAVRTAVTNELDLGAKEIILTGVDITDYEGGLGRLCQRLLASEARLQRLRLSSLDSIEIDDALLELIAGEPRLMPHFHLSLQAGDDMVLKRMKRRHSRADAVRTVERIKKARSKASIGADIIAGFPTETEEMAFNTLKMLNDCDVISAHIFPFSPRPNTPAARMPQVEREIVKGRAARLRSAAAERRAAWLQSQIGTIQPMLVEADGKGHTDAFAPVLLPGTKRGELLKVRIAGLADAELTGERT
jgi:threonylcarbamoyladenosine tRNA methylthiotransferase MtaB